MGAVRAAEELLEALEKRGYKIVEAYLFGSRVRGDWLHTSDVDMVIVSPSFDGIPYIKRLDVIERVQWEEGISPHVETIPLTPEEFKERVQHSIVLRDASRYWLKLRARE